MSERVFMRIMLGCIYTLILLVIFLGTLLAFA